MSEHAIGWISTCDRLGHCFCQIPYSFLPEVRFTQLINGAATNVVSPRIAYCCRCGTVSPW